MKQFLLILFLAFSIKFCVHSQNSEQGINVDNPKSAFYKREEILQPFIKNFNKQEYNGQPQSWSVIQDKRGLIYVANNDGVLEYDGSNWRRIELGNGDATHSLAISNDGIIYVGGYNDLGYIQPNLKGELKFVSLKSFVPEKYQDFSQVWKTHCLNNKVYFQSSEYILIYNPQNHTFKVLEGDFHYLIKLTKHFFVRDRNQGLLKLENEKLNIVKEGSFFTNVPLNCIVPFQDTLSVFGSYDKGLFLYKENKFNPINNRVNDYLQKYNLYHGIKLSNGGYAFGTLTGGTVITDENLEWVQLIDEKNSNLQSNEVNFLFEDSQKSIWFALNNGISRVEVPNALTSLKNFNGSNKSLIKIARNNSNFYCATSQGVYRLNQDYFSNVSIPRFIFLNRQEQSWDMRNLNSNRLLYSDAVNISEISNNSINTLISNNTICYCFRESNDEKLLYIGLGDGVSIYIKNGTQYGFMGKVEGIQDEIRDILEDEKGNLWVATYNSGVIYVDFNINQKKDYLKPKLTVYGEKDGLISTADIYLIKINNKIFFTNTHGLFEWDEKNKKITSSTLLPKDFQQNKGLLRTVQVKNGDIWATVFPTNDHSDESIVVFKNNNGKFEKYFSNLLSRVGKITTTQIFVEDDGVVWVAHENGLIRLNTNAIGNINRTYPAIIRKVTCNNTHVKFNGAFHDSYLKVVNHQTAEFIPNFDYIDNSLRFEVSALSFDGSERNVYQFKLENYDEEWTPWSKETYKDYTQLTEGTYKFRVRAKNVYGIISEEATYEFSIKAPWYRTILAYILYFIGGIGGITLFVGWRIRNLEAAKKQLEKIVEIRTHEVVTKAKELEEKNNEIIQINEEIIQQRDEILAFNEQISTQKEEIEHKNQEILDSIVYARRIQDAILPQIIDIKEALPNSFVLYKPKDIVSGDFFWFFKVEDIPMLAAVDCTGHGIPGAFMSVMGCSLLNQIVNEKGLIPPGEILNALNELVQANLHQVNSVSSSKDGMDLTLSAFDLANNKMRFGGANNPLYFIRDNELIEYKTNKYPIGGGQYEGRNFETQTLELQKGDVIYMFSDGYADQFGGPNKKKFMYGKFKKLLLEIHSKPVEEQKKILDDTIEQWRAESNMEQIDDILVIGVII